MEDENHDAFSSLAALPPAPLFSRSTTTLGSPFRPNSGPFRSTPKSSPAKPTARKVVSSATCAARDSKPRATKVEGLQSRARSVAAKQGGATRKVV